MSFMSINTSLQGSRGNKGVAEEEDKDNVLQLVAPNNEVKAACLKKSVNSAANGN